MIAVETLSVRAGAFRLSGVSFMIPTGEYGVLMGKTACGKTTILEAICGLKRSEAGQIILDGRDITRLKPAERGIGYVPQDGALFSTMTVREHLGFALDIRARPAREIAERVNELAGLLGLSPLLDRRPHGLSGGERQRVALGRALAARPSVLCLDEPLTALDDDTRQEMYDLLRTVRRETGVTTLHVTHSQTEALELADRVFRIENGTVRHLIEWDRAER
jgi:molybdate/tungstate transport system ATP-binding protein